MWCYGKLMKLTRDQTANIHWIIEKARESWKSIYFCFTDYDKTFNCVDHNRLWKILKQMGIPEYLTCHLRSVCRSRSNSYNQTRNNGLVPNWERSTSKAVYYHLAYFTYMQSVSCEMPSWMKHKLESRLLGEISISSDIQTTPRLCQVVKRNERAFDESERRE